MHGQGASNMNYSTVVFNFDVCRLSKLGSSINYGLQGYILKNSHFFYTFKYFLVKEEIRRHSITINVSFLAFPEKKSLYYLWLNAETNVLRDCMSSFSCHQGARKAHLYGEILDSWVENKVLHGNIYSSITQRLFSNVQGGQRLTTSERGSVVLALFVSKKSLTNLFLVLDPRHHSS